VCLIPWSTPLLTVAYNLKHNQKINGWLWLINTKLITTVTARLIVIVMQLVWDVVVVTYWSIAPLRSQKPQISYLSTNKFPHASYREWNCNQKTNTPVLYQVTSNWHNAFTKYQYPELFKKITNGKHCSFIPIDISIDYVLNIVSRAWYRDGEIILH